eukprot:CAMPEP_0194221128 /NCGR_PEP_ID=MMETSP0156-20130528/29939_1 /TAXON_ID=33649 /ORGANISM="Thalassionema nitzschioides, Strain L26-B" /LENGTH=605 /DNA_ID=CAMNT_0038951431 /DNA_START=93 /DNA_END=1907 /DNA_ORIENTATION=+
MRLNQYIVKAIVKLSVFFIVCSESTVFGSNMLSIDLSHQQRLTKSLLQDTIKNSIEKNVHTNHALIDVSFSELGNDGSNDIISSLLSFGNERELPLTLDLTTRMNRITPKGASDVIEQILGSKEDKRNDEMLQDEKSGKEEKETANPSVTTLIRLLDLSWNDLHVGEKGSNLFLSNLRKLIANAAKCPTELVFKRCSLGPAVCRAIGKGLMDRFSEKSQPDSLENCPLSLYICGNAEIGDAGVAALAAAIRGTKDHERVIFSTLDLSACDIGDSGAEALALALESHPKSIRRLILSNNKISNTGASSIANSLIVTRSKIAYLELDNNPGIGNYGATALADAIGKGAIGFLSLRSCNVKADGAKAFGESIKSQALQKGSLTEVLDIDLSGNPLGVLQKKKKDSLKSKASATTASYMNFIGKQIKSGLKDVGLDNVLSTASVESDDEEDERLGDHNEESSDEPARCGAKALASAIVLDKEKSNQNSVSRPFRCNLGMRRCFLDQGAGDALAAMVIHAKMNFGIELVIDVGLNHVLEDDMVRAVAGSDEYTLEDMADRHLEALEAIRIAKDRAAHAAAAAAARNERSNWSDSDYDFRDYDIRNSDNDQ